MIRFCPKCGKDYNDYPAISRRDNKTEICPTCGVKEAMEDYYNYMTNKKKGGESSEDS